jgi:hypothetical protein
VAAEPAEELLRPVLDEDPADRGAQEEASEVCTHPASSRAHDRAG